LKQSVKLNMLQRWFHLPGHHSLLLIARLNWMLPFPILNFSPSHGPRAKSQTSCTGDPAVTLNALSIRGQYISSYAKPSRLGWRSSKGCFSCMPFDAHAGYKLAECCRTVCRLREVHRNDKGLPSMLLTALSEVNVA
jgi:hypothetical protein